MSNEEKISYKIEMETDEMLEASRKFDKMTDSMDRDAKSTTTKINKLSSSISKGLKGSMNVAATGAKVVATGVAAAATALTALAVNAAESSRELKVLANISNMSVESMKEIGFAASSVGIEIDQLGQINQDVFDRLGDMVSEGVGEFDPFLKVVGLSTEAGQELAKELQHLSGPEVLQYMVTQMENAGASQAQMITAMEAMASDASRLIPLLANKGSELNRLIGRYKEYNDTLKLTPDQSEDLINMSESMKLLSTTADNASTLIGASLAPAFTELSDKAASFISQEAQSLVAFLEKFSDYVTSGALYVDANKIFGPWKDMFNKVSDGLGTLTDNFSTTFENLTGVSSSEVLSIGETIAIIPATLELMVNKSITNIKLMVNQMKIYFMEGIQALDEMTGNAGSSALSAASTALERAKALGMSWLNGDDADEMADAILNVADKTVDATDELEKLRNEQAKLKQENNQVTNTFLNAYKAMKDNSEEADNLYEKKRLLRIENENLAVSSDDVKSANEEEVKSTDKLSDGVQKLIDKYETLTEKRKAAKASEDISGSVEGMLDTSSMMGRMIGDQVDSDKEQQDKNASFGRYAADVSMSALTGEDLLQAQMERELEMLEEHYQGVTGMQTEYEEAKTAIAKKYSEQRKALMTEEQSTSMSLLSEGQTEMLSTLGTALGNFAEIAKQGNRKSFENYKLMASAQAGISASLAIIKALAEGGPIAGPILATSIGALAGAQIAQINSMEYGGERRFGGTTQAGNYYRVNETGVPEVYSAGGKDYLMETRNASITPLNRYGSGGTNVNINNYAGVDVSEYSDANEVNIDIVRKIAREEASSAKNAAVNETARQMRRNKGGVYSAMVGNTNMRGKARS